MNISLKFRYNLIIKIYTEFIVFMILLASEVTSGLLAGAEPDTHQFNVTIFFQKGDQMEIKTLGYYPNSGTISGT